MSSSAPAPTPAGWYPDPASGRMRYWNGIAWTEQFQVPRAGPIMTNAAATASLVLGICGFILMAIPFFIGWFIGGPLDILAIIFGIVGLSRTITIGRVGTASAIVGIVLGGLSLLSVSIGAGSIW